MKRKGRDFDKTELRQLRSRLLHHMTPTVKFALFEQTLFSWHLTLSLGDGARGVLPTMASEKGPKRADR